MSINAISSARARLQELQKGLQQEVSLLSIQELYDPPKEGEWSSAQILGHIGELETFWMGKAVQLAKRDGIKVDRTEAEAAVRLKAVEEKRSASKSELIKYLEDSHQQTLASLGEIAIQDLTKRGELRGKPVIVEELINGYVIGHMESHLTQIKENRRVLQARSR